MDWIQLITGLLIAGESLALYEGMKLRKTGWVNPVNNGYVVFDVAIGCILIASAYGAIHTQAILVGASVLTHVIRDYDYYKKVPDRYAFNVPLLVVLNVRLLLLLTILFM